MAKPLKITVLGGGRSAHVMAVLAASQPNMEVGVLTTYQDEAGEWSKAIDKGDMTLTINGPNEGQTRDVKAKPAVVSRSAKDVVPGSDIVLFTVTASAHESYMQAIIPHLDKKAVLVGLPGQAGFEYMCKSMLGELADQITVMSFEISPWICSITEYGQKVVVDRICESLRGSILRGKAIPRKPALMSLQMIVGNMPMLKQVKHYVELIFASYSFMNPAIMYGKWNGYDGSIMESAPLFYEDVDETTATLIETCSKEYQDVAHAISGQRPEVDLSELEDIYKWMLKFYKFDLKETTSLHKAITSNQYYKGVKHIMKKEGRNKFKPDFSCRYLSEDIPCGVLVVRGMAEILGVETPTLDMLIEWGQDKMGKKYLENGKLTGADIGETRTPQRYGFTTVEEILAGKKNESSS